MMNMNFSEKVEKYIEKEKLLCKGDKVVIGVSGGADSTALLYVLYELKEKYSLRLFVVHVNHGLRKEAKEEAWYVENLCTRLNIPFYLKEEDVLLLAKKNSIGTEEAGRKLRYETFEEIAKREGDCKIAVAHNKNDMAETMLFNLFRGTGIKGLSSIPAKRDNIIRPLLCVERSEIENYLNERNIKFYIDASNLTDQYSRNRIRNNIIPVIKANATDNAIDHMAKTAEQLKELYELTTSLCEEAFNRVCANKEKEILVYNKEAFLEEKAYIQKLLIKKAIDELVPNNKDITHIHIESVLDLVKKEGCKQINLPYEIKVFSEYNELSFTRQKENLEEHFEIEIKPPCEYVIGEKLHVYAELKAVSDVTSCSFEKYTKTFDYDKIKGSLVMRQRKAGDAIVINKAGGKKLLKDYMINEKIPAKQRGSVPILADGENVVWVVGYRISEAYKINDETKRVLKITVTEEE